MDLLSFRVHASSNQSRLRLNKASSFSNEGGTYEYVTDGNVRPIQISSDVRTCLEPALDFLWTWFRVHVSSNQSNIPAERAPMDGLLKGLDGEGWPGWEILMG